MNILRAQRSGVLELAVADEKGGCTYRWKYQPIMVQIQKIGIGEYLYAKTNFQVSSAGQVIKYPPVGHFLRLTPGVDGHGTTFFIVLL